MAEQQFDVPKNLKDLFLKKKKQRNDIKAYYKKLVSNPHRPEGIVYDPLIQRYHAMSQYSIEFHRASPKTVASYLGFLVIPITSVGFYLYYKEYSKEKLYRSGQVAYKDRLFRSVF